MDIKYSISENLIFRTVDDEVIILNDNNGCYYSLNEIGSKIWEYISQEKEFCIKNICEFVIKTYDVLEKNLIKDIEELINELLEEKIIYEK